MAIDQRFLAALLGACLYCLPANSCLAENGAGTLHPAELRCEGTVDPLGLGEASPELSWISESARRGAIQRAYQVIVASSAQRLAADTGDLWDSGRVLSDESAHVVYAGRALASQAECFWKVRLWDRDDQPSEWSPSARWSMGLLQPADWRARWIEATPASFTNQPPAITVRHAVYETTDGTIAKDVTSLVAAEARQNPGRELPVENSVFGGDPAYGKVKQLRVVFQRAQELIETTVPEKGTLSFYQAAEPLRYLRKTFTLHSPIRSATLYVTALGLYECRLNGQRVGDHVLAPDWTDYYKRVRYQAYDVTSLARPGGNTLGALLGNGWYAGHVGLGNFQIYGKTPALLAQLEIAYADGSTERIVTDGTWKTHPSPVLSADLLLGESYDARKEVPGWDQPGFNEQDWLPATERDEALRALDAQVSPPVRQLGERHAIAPTAPVAGHWIFDLGQNMVGVVRLKVNAPAGTVVTIRHAEMLNPDGTIYTDNLRAARSTDTYTCKGGGEETWQPRFTFHGFRYVELTGLPEKPAPDAVTGIVLGTDSPKAGSFTCSNPLVNQLVSNIEWGQRGNYLSVPTDCPQRDERLGWMGDAEVFVHTATTNANIDNFFAKWLVDVDDAQTADGAFADVSPKVTSGDGSPAWADAGVICPWTIYAAYGDRRILERHLPAMTKWVEWCRRHSTNLIRDKDRGGDFGDWLSVEPSAPKDLIGTAYFAYSTHLVAQAYSVVGQQGLADQYKRLFEDIRQAFNAKYVAADGRLTGDSQCAYAMALKFDLLPAELRPRAVEYLEENIAAHGNHLTTGFVGVSYLLPALTAGGKNETAYRLLLQESYPSWLFSVKQGATTIWERWDGWTPEKGFQNPAMNSFNHYSLGSCGEWLYSTVAGIAWDDQAPGYKRMVLHPRVGGGLTRAQASLRTNYGLVSSGWMLTAGKFSWDVVIPPNTAAKLILPAANVGDVTESGQSLSEVPGVQVLAPSEGEITLELGSGLYHFECPAEAAKNQ